MFEKSQEYLRLAVAAAVILIGLSVAYHYVIYIPAKDREEKLEERAKSQAEAQQAGAKQEAAEKTALGRRANYRICLSNAQETYSNRWDSTCKVRSEAAAQDRTQCLERGSTQEYCEAAYPALPPKNCELSGGVSDNYDSMLKEDRKRCLDEARSDVLAEP